VISQIWGATTAKRMKRHIVRLRDRIV